MNKLSKLYDRTGAEKWAHPEAAAVYSFFDAMPEEESGRYFFNQAVPLEERKVRIAENAKAATAKFGVGTIPEFVKMFKAPGCPEEPDAPEIDVSVVYPDEVGKKKLPVLFSCLGGGFFACAVNYATQKQLANDLNCAVISPKYRLACDAKYPAAMNDLHAGYKWVIDNAADLGVNAKKIVIFGQSTGSHLALSLAHRVKRFGYRPCGCVVEAAFADNRPIYPSCKMIHPAWDNRSLYFCGLQWLGVDSLPQYQTPEMFPNSCEAEDCIGLCPTFIHADTEESHADSCRAYTSKLTEAGVYNELHCWGGSTHGVMTMINIISPDSDYGKRYQRVVYGNIKDCWEYDLRRLWIEDEMKAEK